MGDYSQYPQQQQATPPPTPQPQQGGGFSIWDLLGPVLRAVLPPQVTGFGDQMMNVYHMAGNNAIRSYANLAQDPAVNAMMYGQWPQGAPANPWPTVPALPPGAAPGSAGLTDADRNRLQVQGPSSALGGYQPMNRPGPGMPPRVLTLEDTKTQLNSAEAEAWRRYNAGGAAGTSNVPPYAPPVIGPPGHYLYLTQHQDSKGQWVNSYGPRAPVAQTGQVAGATNPLAHPDTHGAGPPLPGDQGRNLGGPPPPPPPTSQGGRTTPQGHALAGKGFEWKTGDGQVHSGIVDPDGMHIVSPDGASGIIAIQPDGSFAVIESTPQQANNTPTTTNPTTTSTPTTTNPPRTLQSTSTSQPPRMLSSTTSTLPPSSGAGGAVAAPGASGGAPPAAAGAPSSPDMQLLDSIPLPPTTATTQTPTTTQPPTTGAPQTATTQTPTTSQPPTTAAPSTDYFPLGPHPPRPIAPGEPGAPIAQERLHHQGGDPNAPLVPGYPSPAFQPPGERAGLAVGQAVGTAPGAEPQPQPSILARAAGALAPAEAQAGGPPGGPGGPGPADTSQQEQQPVPEETPSEPTTVLQPSQQRSADISQAIARNTNGIQNYIRKTYPQYPKMFDIPPSIRENDGVLIDAGDAIARSREADMAAARAQATPERRAQLDAANNAYNRLWLLYRTPIGAKGYTGLDASLPTADKPGFNRGILESGNFFKELSQGGGPAKWVGDFGHAMSRSGAGIPNAPGSLESVEQMAGRGGEEGQAATNFLQGHTVAIPIARALGASGRVNQRELALIQQYLIPSPDTLYEGNFQKLQNTLDTLDAVRRGYAVDPGKTGTVLMTGPDGIPHLVEQGGGTGPDEGGPKIAVPGPIGGSPPPRQIGR